VFIWLVALQPAAGQVVVSDTFAGGDGTSLAAHWPDVRPIGSEWVLPLGGVSAAALQGGHVTSATGGSVHQTWAVNSGVSDAIVAVDFTGTVPIGGVIARASSEGFVSAYVDNGSIHIVRMRNGVPEFRASSYQGLVAGQSYRLELRAIGSTLSAYLNGSLKLEVTDSFNITSTYHGIDWYNGDYGAAYDNFEVRSVPPAIALVTPSSGPIGATVTVAGANFGATQGTSALTFNGVPAAITSWSASSITAVVPNGATTGPVVATVQGQASNGVSFAVPLHPAVSDSFTGTNGTTLQTHAPEVRPNGAAWTLIPAVNSTATLQNGRLAAAAGGATHQTWAIDSGFSDVAVAVDFNGTVPTGGVVARVSSQGWISAFVDNGSIHIVKMQSGSPVFLGSSYEGIAAGQNYRLELRANGSALSAYLNGSLKLSRTDSFNIGATAHGVDWYNGDSGATFDNFEVRPLPPAITAVSPVSGVIGASVMITGTGFGASQGTSLVRFNGSSAAITAWSNTSITATVPLVATTGPLVVVVDGQPSNSITFAVPAANAVVWDTFTGTNGTGLGSHAPEVRPSGAIWSLRSTGTSTATLQNGRLAIAPGGATHQTWAINSGLSDVVVGIDFTGTVPIGGVVARVNAQGFVSAWVDNNSLYIVRMQNGTPTFLASSYQAISAGQNYRLELRAIGSALSAYLNGVLVLTASESFNLTETAHGVDWYNGDTGATYDHFEVRPPAPVATISALSPTAGPIGTSVTITGANFGSAQGASTVKFSNRTATVTNWSDTSITATVPAAAVTGPVVVTVYSLSSNAQTFTVQPPSVSGLSPSLGLAGTSVTIAGSRFGASQGTSTVWFNGFVASVSTWSDTSIVATVPAAASTGPVTVVTGSQSSNSLTFTVPVMSATLQADRHAPQPPGTSITWTATPSWGFPPYTYKWLLWDGTRWTTLQDWTSSNTFVWTPTSPNMAYAIRVAIRNTGNTADNCNVCVDRRFPIGSAPNAAVVWDSFIDGGRAIENHTPDISPGGAHWVRTEGATSPIVNDGALLPPSGNGYAMVTIPSGTSNGQVGVNFTATSAQNFAALVLRVVDENNLMVLRFVGSWSAGRIELLRRANGAFVPVTWVPVGPVTPGTTHRIEAHLSGSSITARFDGRSVFETSVQDFMTATRHGVMWNLANDATTTFGDFSVATAPHTPTLPAGTRCVGDISPEVMNIPAEWGEGFTRIEVWNMPSACEWTSRVLYGDWVTLRGSAIGSGPGLVQLIVNDIDPAPRMAYVVVAGRLATIAQVGLNGEECTFPANPGRLDYQIEGGTQTLTVTPNANYILSCPWVVMTSAPDWASLSNGDLHFGQGTVQVSVPPNPGLGTRNAFLTVGRNNQFTVEQTGDYQCTTMNVSPTAFPSVSVDGDTFNAHVQFDSGVGNGCGWKAESLHPNMMEIELPNSNPSGDGDFRIHVFNNPQPYARTGTVQVYKPGYPALFTITVTQCGTAASCDPQSPPSDPSTWVFPPVTGQDPGGTVSYLHTDAIGSVRMITDANQTATRFDYLPFGEPWGAQSASTLKFTGKERDTETLFGGQSLDYFGARYFQSQLARFTTVDPGHVNGNAFDPQSWNGYAYARNNPLRYIDPLGLYDWDAECNDQQCDKNRDKFRDAVARIRAVFETTKAGTPEYTELKDILERIGTENDGNHLRIAFSATLADFGKTVKTPLGRKMTLNFDLADRNVSQNEAFDFRASVVVHETRHALQNLMGLGFNGLFNIKAAERPSYNAESLFYKALGTREPLYGLWDPRWSPATQEANRKAVIESTLRVLYGPKPKIP